MFDVCPNCGMYSTEKTVDPKGPYAICPFCNYKHPFVRLPLFIIGGPSGAGKTTTGLALIGKLPECVIMESDILWRPEFATPADNYAGYRSMWLRVALAIHQSGRPVVLVGTANPDQFEPLPERRYFSAIHYLTLVCRNDILEKRLRSRPPWRGCDDAFIKTMLDYNAWLKKHAAQTKPPMELLDTSDISTEESAQQTKAWIKARLSL